MSLMINGNSIAINLDRVSLDANIGNTTHKTQDMENSDFEKLLNKITGGEIAQGIRDNYNVTLNVGAIGNVNDLLNTYDFKCKNYVGISQETLSKMEQDPALKKKIMSAIEEFCSPEEQAKVNALQPPVKSAGMIIYPDGDVLYWLEGYPNNLEDASEKKSTVSKSNIDDVIAFYNNPITNVVENDIESAIQILSTAFKRKDI